jgi:hypothetical protein
MITTPSFNPSYSNVPQNKPLKPAPLPQNKPLRTATAPDEEPEDDPVSLLNGGRRLHIFSKREESNPSEAQLKETSVPSTTQISPMLMSTLSEMTQLPQRLNPNRPIFV